MSDPMKWIFYGGQWVDNAETLGAVATHRFTVPAGKRWRVQSVYTEVDTSATLLIQAFSAANELLFDMYFQAASTNNISLGPSTLIANRNYPLMAFYLESGCYILVTWGAAQGTPEVSCTVFEVNTP